MGLAQDILAGSRRALARALTQIENDHPDATRILAELYPHTGHAHLIGVTGAPGTGKSSLVNQLALAARTAGRTVGIVAVDPTSPFSGGAILGDRIRMRDLAGDSGIFIRSMASRGSLGGLARATSDVLKALDGAGFDILMIETVGAGQSEVEIASYAHTVLVVEAPGLGDDVQAIKAGILEIADILVVNKSDDPRAQGTLRALRAMLDLGHPAAHTMAHHGHLMEVLPVTEVLPENTWMTALQMTNANSGEGVADLLAKIDQHRKHLIESGELGRREQARAASEIDALLRERLLARLLDTIETTSIARMVEQVATRQLLPRLAVEQLLEQQHSRL
jgi:LAO/AO transport system kinase